MRRSLFAPLVLAAACTGKSMPAAVPVSVVPATPPPVVAGPPTLEQLTDGTHVAGFTVRALYLDDAGHPVGARFVHDRTHFTVDYLRIESAPQTQLWVTTFPTSDK